MALTLRAEAPTFLMPPPGLETLCELKGISPCSTALPSPALGPQTSPFAGSMSSEPFEFELLGCEDSMMLPETSITDVSQESDLIISPVVWSSDFEFKLSGIEDFQNSLVSLFASMEIATPPTTDGSGSESSGTTTPPTCETMPVSEPAAKKGWGLKPACHAEKDTSSEAQTSVTIENVPKKYTRDLLSKRLDEAGFSGNYDLIYVVADLKQRNSGSGTALVNFCSEDACIHFMSTFHKKSITDAFPGFVGKNGIQVMPASTQGLDANVRKLEKSGVLMSMLADRPGWQPARYNSTGQIEAEIGC